LQISPKLAIRGVIEPLLAPVLPRPNRGHTPSAAVRGNLGRN